MKKRLAIFLAICMFCLSSCSWVEQGVEIEQTDEMTVIKLENFKGKKEVMIVHDSPGEGSLCYSTDIASGSVTVSCDQGWLWDADELFTASSGNNYTDGGYYIDSSTTKITIIIEAEQETSGEIRLWCS